MKKLWKKVTPIPPEMNGHGYLWDCTKCGYCLTSWESYPKCDCPRCGATEQTDVEVTRNALRTDCNGCKFVGWYDTEFPCVNCTRKNKDYYTAEQTEREGE